MIFWIDSEAGLNRETEPDCRLAGESEVSHSEFHTFSLSYRFTGIPITIADTLSFMIL